MECVSRETRPRSFCLSMSCCPLLDPEPSQNDPTSKKITRVCYTHGVESEQKHSQNSENLVKNFIQGVLFHMSFQSRRLPCL